MAEATKEVVATYRSAEEARTAIQALERRGIDAEQIRMIGTPGVNAARTDYAMREPDEVLTRTVGRRALGGSIALAVVAAIIVFVVARFVLDAAVGAAVAFAAGAFMAGGALGFFYGGAASLAGSGGGGGGVAGARAAASARRVPGGARGHPPGAPA